MTQNLREKLDKKIKKMPTTPGVYFFLDNKRKILYIGKATNLRSRVRSYFSGDIGEKRGPLIERMVQGDLDVKFKKTDSVLEALMLEALLIKKHSPEFNSKGKDQKSWNYVILTKEKFPRVLIERGRELFAGRKAQNEAYIFGPFPNSNELKIALKIIRRIFPFRDKCEPFTKACFNFQIGLCPGPCAGAITEKEYKKTIRNIVLFFRGKKKVLIKNLEKEMRREAKNREFEKAEEIKKKIFALNHINDIALIKGKSDSVIEEGKPAFFRMEAYDISHISGTNMVGVMTVIEDGEVKKNDYRMFKIREQRGADDTKALKEILERRFRHKEWAYPNLIVLDGGVAQLNLGSSFLQNIGLGNIRLVSVLKDERHKPKDILGDKEMANKYKREILLSNSEAHRFVLGFHRKIRGGGLLSI